MEVDEIKKRFPGNEECVRFISSARWGTKTRCPYCTSTRVSVMARQHRWHCNRCHTSFSAVSGTPLHATKAPLQKWLMAVTLFHQRYPRITSRVLAGKIGVTKTTAAGMLKRLRLAPRDQHDFLERLIIS